jgi:hypothetical protein
MALNSSGNISLGGAVTGQSIALELGLSGTATISLNDTVVRTLLGASSGQISMNLAYGKSSASYFFAQMTTSPSQYNNYVQGLVDSSGNIYVVYSIQGSANQRLFKLDSSGSLSLQKYNSTAVNLGPLLMFDGANNTGNIIVHSSYTSGSSYSSFENFNTSLDINNFKYQSTSVYLGRVPEIKGTALDSSGNMYVLGTYQHTYGSCCCLNYEAFNYMYRYPSGFTTYTRGMSFVASYNDQYSQSAGQISLDSTGNVYSVITKDSGSGGSFSQNPVLLKSNSTFDVVSAKAVYITNFLGGTVGYGKDVLTDSSGNIYMTILNDTDSEFALVKLDSSEAFLWARRFTGPGTSGSLKVSGIQKDSSDNIYVYYGSINGSNYSPSVNKYNSSGTLQWQRRITPSTGSFNQGSITRNESNMVVTSGGIHIFAYFGTGVNAWYPIVLKIPLDGSLTGTYALNGVNFTYAAYTGTDATGLCTVYVGGSTQFTHYRFANDRVSGNLTSGSATASAALTDTLAKVAVA